MAGRCLLDTSIVIALFAGDADVQQRLSEASEVFLPSIALGELYYGARNSAHEEVNVQRVDDLAAGSAVLVCDVATAGYYGLIKNGLKAKGKPLPENDIWIAALAVQHGLSLISRDAHFEEIDNLMLEAW